MYGSTCTQFVLSLATSSIYKLCCIFVPEELFILANSEDPDEMPHNAAFHQGPHCLLRYLLAGIQNQKR